MLGLPFSLLGGLASRIIQMRINDSYESAKLQYEHSRASASLNQMSALEFLDQTGAEEVLVSPDGTMTAIFRDK